MQQSRDMAVIIKSHLNVTLFLQVDYEEQLAGNAGFLYLFFLNLLL